jgi:hypothetical protein
MYYSEWLIFLRISSIYTQQTPLGVQRYGWETIRDFDRSYLKSMYAAYAFNQKEANYY